MKKVVKIVTAAWCGQCPSVKKAFAELLEERGDFTLELIDADTQEKEVANLRVRGLPTTLLYRDGELVKSIVGPKQKSVFAEALEEL